MEVENKKRDNLAEDRTYLANERTLLAHWRTSLNFFVLGAFLLKFFPSLSLVIVSFISIIFGILLIIYGTIKFLKYKDKIKKR